MVRFLLSRAARVPRFLAILPLLGVAALAAVLFLRSPAPAHAAMGYNIDIPLDQVVSYGCFGDPYTDTVHLTGTIHSTFHLTTDASGGVHFDTHNNYQDVSGIGLLTGDSYQANGTSNASTTANGGPYLSTFTSADEFKLIGQGAGTTNNYTAHDTLHYTVNADGTLTAVVHDIVIDCPSA